MKLTILFLALAMVAGAQTKINPERDISALPVDSIVINRGGALPAIIRAPICQDRTGATCPVGSFFVDAATFALRAVMPLPAAARFRCQDPLFASAQAAQIVAQIAESTFVPTSLMVFRNGLKLTDKTAPDVAADYARSGQAVTIAGPIHPGDRVELCYAF